MERLRDYLTGKLQRLGEPLPVAHLVRACYREFLLRAATLNAPPAPASCITEKLKAIAEEFLQDLRHLQAS